MKKTIVIVFVIFYSILFLAGCSDTGTTEPTNGTEETIIENNSIKTKVETTSTFIPSDLIIRTKGIEGSYNEYFFGGFLDNDTFTINVIKNANYHIQNDQIYYFTFEKGLHIVLPFTNIDLEIVDFNVKENTITFKQTKE